jgi:hypothetical protein
VSVVSQAIENDVGQRKIVDLFDASETGSCESVRLSAPDSGRRRSSRIARCPASSATGIAFRIKLVPDRDRFGHYRADATRFREPS